MTSARERIAIGTVLLLLLGYHCLTIQRQSLFIDEWSELHIAQLPVAQLAFKADSMPPLFSLLLRGWLALWGDPGARWLSAACHAVSVVALWRFVRQLVSPQVGVASAVVMAAMPLPLFYAQFVRGYALVGLLAVLACGFFALAVRGANKAWPPFVVASVVGIFCHYYFVLLLASLVAVLLISVRGRVTRPAVLSLVAICVLASPILLFLKSDFAYQKHLRDARSMNVASIGYTYASFFSGYTLGPAKAELQTLSTSKAAQRMAPWLAAIVLCAGPLAWFGFKRLEEARIGWPVVGMVVLPVMLTGGIGLALGMTYNVRFVAWCAAPLAVLVGAGVETAFTRRRWLCFILLVLGILTTVALFNRHYVPRYFNEDLRAAADHLREHADESAVVFCVSDYLAHPLRYYLGERLPIVELPEPGATNVVVSRKADAEQGIAVCREYGDRPMWLVESRGFHGDPQGMLVDRMQSELGFEVAAQLPGITLYRAGAP